MGTRRRVRHHRKRYRGGVGFTTREGESEGDQEKRFEKWQKEREEEAEKEAEQREKEARKKANLAKLRGQRTEAPMRVETVAQARAMGITPKGKNLNPYALYADGGRRTRRRRHTRRRR